MDISVFLTQQAAQGGKGPATGASLTSSSGVFAGGEGLTFMDLIFARLNADTQEGGENGEQSHNHPLLKKLAEKIAGDGELKRDFDGEFIISNPDYEGHTEPLTSQQILQTILETDPASLQELVTEFSQDGASPDINISAFIDVRKKLAAYLEDLLHALPQESKPAIIEITPAEVKQVLGRIQTEINNGENPALIATGLTPEKLTEIIENIANGDEQGESFVIGLVKILPPEGKKEALFLPRGSVVAGPQHPAGEISTPTEAKLTALAAGEDGAALEESDFDGLLRVLERAQGKGEKVGQQDSTNGIENAIKHIKQNNTSAGLSTVQGAPPAPSSMFSDFTMGDVFPEGWDFAPGSSNSLNLTGPAQLTSIVSHIQQAGIPHPATQTVASAIAKATTNGETKNITIRLDPPALGKVSIRMEFNKESNAMKALLVAEKPETFLMLQRDAHILERALQEAGLDTDGGLQFELSQDSNMFEQDEHSTGGNSGGGSDDASNEDGENIEIIETRMDWYIDPETGAMRYDALV